MWVWIWVGLILAAIATFVIIGIWLWRRGSRLLASVTNAYDQLERLGHVEDAESDSGPRPVTALGDVKAARAYREQRWLATYQRKARRKAERRTRWQQWSSFNE